MWPHKQTLSAFKIAKLFKNDTPVTPDPRHFCLCAFSAADRLERRSGHHGAELAYCGGPRQWQGQNIPIPAGQPREEQPPSLASAGTFTAREQHGERCPAQRAHCMARTCHGLSKAERADFCPFCPIAW